MLFNVTVVAFAKEKSFVKPKLTLWFYAAGDLVGRLFSGQLSGKGISIVLVKGLKLKTIYPLGRITTRIVLKQS